MRILLDTHALLWALDDRISRLTGAERAAIDQPDNIIYVSGASLWELAIKASIGKIQLPAEFFSTIPTLGYEILLVSVPHIEHYKTLPLNHRDPFDRMLVAQAQQEQLTLLTHDEAIASYEVDLLA